MFTAISNGMKPAVIKTIQIIVLVFLLGWAGLFLAHKIDLTTADLGRHIQNGNVIVHGSWRDKWAVLHTNFYSYTLPNQPFVNHHWLSGAVFYLIHQAFGFAGLSVFYILLSLATLLLFFEVARKASNFWIAFVVTIPIIPLITSRAEVRPEVFTYFFTAVFFYILWHWQIGKLKHTWLMLLPGVLLFWVNLHIGFIFGFLVLGAFGLEQLIKFLQKKPNGFMQLLLISGLCLAAGLVNPFGYKILVYPFLIFKNYGYLIVENQSVRFLENLNHTDGLHFLLFKIIVGAAALAFVATLFKHWPASRRLRLGSNEGSRGGRKFDIALFILTAVTAVMAYLGIRHFPSFAFFALPVIAAGIYAFWPGKIHPAYLYAMGFVGVAAVGFCLFNQSQDLIKLRPVLGVGLLPNTNASADFFKAQNIQGPIFNNYDIGGYLVFNLYPQKVFVDNRPEAYTNDFFQKTYIPAQADEKKWQELDDQYHFNSIFFAYHDLTPWAQAFLINRVQDKNWAPVFVDPYNIIFVRLTRQNLEIIKKYQISKDNFTTVQP